MAYTWQNIIDNAAPFSRNLPIASIDVNICNRISSEIWTAHAWKRAGSTCTNIALGQIPLVDGVQDYSPPTNMFRLLSAYIRRTDTTPDTVQDIDVAQDLGMDLVKRSYTSIRSVCQQAGFGVLRLESAISVPASVTLELGGIYQTNHTTLTSLATAIWLDDRNAHVIDEGLLYWLYKLGDDPRAGGIQKVENGRAVYTGQYAQFRARIDAMAAEEDFGDVQSFFPSETLGDGRSVSSGLNIFPGS